MKSFVLKFLSLFLALFLLVELVPVTFAQASEPEDLTKWNATNSSLTRDGQDDLFSFSGLPKKGNSRQYNKLISPIAYQGNMAVSFEVKFSTTANDTMLFFTPRGVAAEDPGDNFTAGYLCNFVIAGSNNGLRFGESNSSSNILSSDRQISANSAWTETNMWYTVKWVIQGDMQYIKYWPSSEREPEKWVYQYEAAAGKVPASGNVIFAKRGTDAVQLRNVMITPMAGVCQSVAPMESLRVPKGTAFADLQLPDTATVYMSDNTTRVVRILNWEAADYQANEAGSYVLSGILDMEEDENPLRVSASLSVNVYDDSIRPEGVISLRYDDRYDVSGMTVSVLDAGVATSYQVGYGIAGGLRDQAVVRYDNVSQQIVAVGTGSAYVKIDGKVYCFEVTPAPISLFLMIGQSNMAGNEGDAKASIANTDGQVYSSYAPATAATLPGATVFLTEKNASSWVASSLAGAQKGIAVDGSTGNLARYPIDSLTTSGNGKMGPDSGFAYEWVKLTGEKVWLVNAAHGGSNITSWQPSGANYKEAVAMFQAAQKTLQAEILAGHYTLSHMGYFWCQGCNTNDRQMDAQWYVEKFAAMHRGLKSDLSTDVDKDGAAETLEFANIILCRSCSHTNYACQHTDKSWTNSDYCSYVDLEMSGPRVAQYYMANSIEAEFADVHMVSNIGDQWVYWQDGSDDVRSFFLERYPSGRFDYEIQSGSLALPAKPEDVHDSIHYNQAGYNEVGREAARNTYYLLNPSRRPQVEATVKLLAWDGVTDLSGETEESAQQIVVPVVWPLYRAKELRLTATGKTYEFYNFAGEEPGRLVATLGTQNVKFGALEDEGGTTPPDDGNTTPPDDSGMTPPDDGSTTPPDDSSTTPPDDGSTTPPDDSDTTPPDDNGTTPPDDSGTTPPDDSGTTPPDDGGMTPPDDSGTTPTDNGEPIPTEDSGTLPKDNASTAPSDVGAELGDEKKTSSVYLWITIAAAAAAAGACVYALLKKRKTK